MSQTDIVQHIATFLGDDLLEGLRNDQKPRFRVALDGGYGLKLLLESRWPDLPTIDTFDLDITVSVSDSTWTLEETHAYWTRRLNELAQYLDLTVEPVLIFKRKNGAIGEPDFMGHTKYALHRLSLGDQVIIELLITDHTFEPGMFDLEVSLYTGFPVKTEIEYLNTILMLVYMDNVRDTNGYTYRKRNVVDGKFPEKGERDLERANLLCKLTTGFVPYRRYCDFLATVSVERLRQMPAKERDLMFKKVFTGLKNWRRNH